jgi:hypothetical protein
MIRGSESKTNPRSRFEMIARQGLVGVENAVSKTVQYAFVFSFILSVKALNKRRETSIQGSR